MTLAVKPKNLKKVIKIFNKRGVDATLIGKFTKEKKAIVKYNNIEVLNLNMDFLHEGYPKLNLKTSLPKINILRKKQIKNVNLINKLHKLLLSPNIVSKEFIATQYDHEVQGTSIIKPLQGKGRVFGNSTAIKPLFDNEKTIALSQAAFPQYAETNPYQMAACSIDTAFKNLIVSGANLKKIAILDNFCWCSSDDPERLYQLKEAARGCYDYSVAYQTPFISGKDSMFNDFKGYNKKGHPIKISIPPTLLISSIGIVDKISYLTKITPEVGDLIFIIGKTKNQLQNSEYEKIFGFKKTNLPNVEAKESIKLYKNFEKANKLKLFNSALGVDLGGVGITLIKMAIASNNGLEIDLSSLSISSIEQFLFSETQSRIVVSIKKNNVIKFKKLFGNSNIFKIGTCNDSNLITFRNKNKMYCEKIINFEKSYKQKIKGL